METNYTSHALISFVIYLILALLQITSDFVAAATKGAIAVVDGNVMAINPGEDEK